MILDALPFALGIMWIFRAVHRAAMDELANERKNIRSRLNDLYRQLERGEISEAQFDEKEGPLLDRLDELGDQDQG